MFEELFDIIRYIAKKIFTSRLFVISLVFIAMTGALLSKMYDLQINKSAYYQENYTQLTQKTVSIPATRGKIYDRNGTLLAYNEISYTVGFTDTGKLSNGFEKNDMLIPLLRLLRQHGEKVVNSFAMARDNEGKLVFTNTSESEKITMLINIYGVNRDKLDVPNDKGVILYPSDDPEYLYEQALYKFGITYVNDRTFSTDHPNRYELEDEIAMDLLQVRYAMYLYSYMRYEQVAIARNLKLETVTEILERQNEFPDVGIGEDTIRRYNYPIYFAHMIGYTGVGSSEIMKDLKEQDPSYEDGDVVGRSGLESVMELYLSGKKGSRTMMLDSSGRIRNVLEETEPEAGNDIYLSVDATLTQAVYHLLEQKLAGILCEHLVNAEVDLEKVENSSNIKIPVKDAYYQMINNNILSMSQFAREDASDPEREMYDAYQYRKSDVVEWLRQLLLAREGTIFNDLPEDLQDYYDCLFDFLTDSGVFNVRTDEVQNDSIYRSYRYGEVSFPELLYHAVENNWIQTGKLTGVSGYTTADNTYELLVYSLMEQIQKETDFTKLIYKYLIKDGSISGNQICLALFYQEFLPWDDEAVYSLTYGNANAAFNFIYQKILNLEITPAQLALDPCTASCTITDPSTGELLAVVTYPGYDNNRFSGTVDASYYHTLLEDLSTPLYNNATQTRTAPGSTFKMVTAIAGLEEGVITPTETILDKSIFTEIGLKLRCAVFPDSHGAINVWEAIRDSCNYFFCEVGFRLSKDENGKYNEPHGLEVLSQYASLFGFDTRTGIEISEMAPHITDIAPVPSSIGQGSHSYTNVQMARYATAIANQGDVYNFSLLQKRTSATGMLLQEYGPDLDHEIEIPQATWDLIARGMREDVNVTLAKVFETCPVLAAAKTGTAEESSKRGPHALFVTYAPYDAPEIAMAVTIPHGYTSSNAAEVAKDIYDYYFGILTMEDVLSRTAALPSGLTVRD